MSKTGKISFFDFFKKNIKIQLLTGYFYATTEYLFFLNKENDIYNIVDEGKNIIKKLYDNNQEKFEVYIFYICIFMLPTNFLYF